MHRNAFTIVEILITISIVVILVGLLLAGANAVRNASVKSRTEVTVGMVANGLAAAVGERKSLPIVPHPLASTKAPRQNFRRGGIDPIRQEERHWAIRRTGWGGRSAPSINADFGSAVGALALVPTGATGVTGDVLLGGERVYFASNFLARRRLLGNDVFSNQNIRVAFGAKREILGMLGILNSAIHDHVLAPAVDSVTGERRESLTGAVEVSYTNVAAVISSQPRLVVAPTRSPADDGWYTDQEEAVRRALESVWNELGKNQAIRKVTSGTFLLNGRYLFDPAVNTASTVWRPGDIHGAVSGIARFRDVCLPGVSIIDGYGVELFISQAHDGRIRVISAGKDGCLRVSPGPDGVITTPINRDFTTFVDDDENTRFTGLAGDDRVGTYDNISVGVVIDDYLDRLVE